MPTSASVKGSRSHVLICAEFGGEDLMQPSTIIPALAMPMRSAARRRRQKEARPQTKRMCNQQCHAGLTWTLTFCFRGRWISAPDATSRASDSKREPASGTRA